MSKSGNKMTHINYKSVKDRMYETNKGFWKVQSIHKLTKRLESRYSPKDYIILKTIKKPDPKLPSFISLLHEKRNKKGKIENQKNFSSFDLNVKNFFITGNERRILKEKNKAEIKNIFDRLFGGFTYEPFLYNDCQFFYLQKEQRLLPRKFKDVVKDSLAFREYKNYLNQLQKTKDENITTDKNIDVNLNKNLSYLGKESSYKNLFEKLMTRNKIKSKNKNPFLIRHKIVKRKCFSSHDIKDTKLRRAILLKSEVGNKTIVKKFPTINFNSIYKQILD